MSPAISRQTRQNAQTAARAAAAANTVRGHVSEAVALRAAVNRTPVTAPGNGLLARLGRNVSSFTHANAGAVDAARRLGGAAGVVTGGLGAATHGSAAARSLGDAFTAARRGDRAEARRQLGAAGSESLQAARGVGTAARGAITIQNVGTARRGATAAVEAFRHGGGFAGLSSEAARTMEATVATAGSRMATAAATTVPATARAAEASIEVGRRALTAGALHGGTEAALRVAEQAGEAGLRAGARAGASTLGRAAARYAPGVNVAMAVVDSGLAARDTYNAYQHPTARNIGRAALSGLTAAGSIVSATNIPIVSQIGATAATVTGFIGALF